MPGGVNAPLALGERLAKAAPNLARWVPVPGADHNDILENDSFIQELHTTLSAIAPKP
jgi:pimeloyl-ACP methyl ester carboxylesterase